MNVDPMQLQMMAAQNPQMAESISGVVPNVAELDCDIIIADGPDGVTLQFEQWQQLTELAKAGIPIPPDELIRAAPGLKNKAEILERMAKRDPMAEKRAMIEMSGAQAKVFETEQSGVLKQAQAAKTMQEAQLAPMKAQHDMEMDGAHLMQADQSARMKQEAAFARA
jgi:hypothetical protein